MLRFTIVLILIPLFSSCNMNEKVDREALNAEILNIEKAFETRLAENGMEEAFMYYAADNAVLNRQNKLIKGKTAIKAFLTANPFPPNSSLKWTPDFIEISNSGDLAYTYGNFIFAYPDSSGQIQESSGVFHTVWKKQDDGTWKYVWD